MDWGLLARSIKARMMNVVKLRVRVRVKVKSQKSKLDPEVGVVMG